MKEAIKVFGKDYIDLFKHSLKFSKDHWKGLLAITVAIGGIEYVLLKREFKEQETRVQIEIDKALDALEDFYNVK